MIYLPAHLSLQVADTFSCRSTARHKDGIFVGDTKDRRMTPVDEFNKHVLGRLLEHNLQRKQCCGVQQKRSCSLRNEHSN